MKQAMGVAGGAGRGGWGALASDGIAANGGHCAKGRKKSAREKMDKAVPAVMLEMLESRQMLSVVPVAPSVSLYPDGVGLSWQEDSQYPYSSELQRSIDDDNSFSAISYQGIMPAYDSSAPPGHTVYYRVTDGVNTTPASSITLPSFSAPGVAENTTGTVDLSWSSYADARNFTIERRCGSEAFTGIAQVSWNGSSPLTFSDCYASPGTVYDYRIRSESAFVSEVSSITTRVPFDAPSLSNSDGVVHLSWSAHGSSGTYSITRCTDGASFGEPIGSTSATSFDDGNVLGDITYYYRIWDGSDYSQISAITVSLEPIAPPAVSVLSPYAMRIQWTIPSNNGSSTVRILRNGTPVVYSESSTFSTSGWTIDVGLTPGTDYEYQVQALDGAGQTSAITPIRTPASRGVIRVGASSPKVGTGRNYVLRVAYPGGYGVPAVSSLLVDWGDGSDPDNDSSPGEIITGTPDILQHAYGGRGPVHHHRHPARLQRCRADDRAYRLRLGLRLGRGGRDRSAERFG